MPTVFVVDSNESRRKTTFEAFRSAGFDVVASSLDKRSINYATGCDVVVLAVSPPKDCQISSADFIEQMPQGPAKKAIVLHDTHPRATVQKGLGNCVLQLYGVTYVERGQPRDPWAPVIAEVKKRVDEGR